MHSDKSASDSPDLPTGSYSPADRQPAPGADRSPSAGNETSHAAADLVKILDQYLDDLKAGCAPSRAELIARHPQFADQLDACMAGLEFLHAAESPHPDHLQTLGDFRILREVGRGGMGAVFEAQQISLGRRVALKILRFGSVSDPQAIERFRREAETVAKLHHTNIVPIFAVGSERGVNYYAMQFIEGRSLAQVSAHHGGPLGPELVADWGLQAADALSHAHQRGVIHRDVKPSNLILDNEQRLWLTDFGLARRLDDVTLSLTGALLGTPRYMSPEQASATHKNVDHRSDLFSLGATLYELLAGQPAFAGHTPHEVIQHILQCEPQPIRRLIPDVPRDLETIVHKCMAKEPGERYDNARELATDLRAFLDGRPIAARRASRVELAVRWLRQQQRSVRLVAAATAATLLLTLFAVAGWRGYDAWRQTSLKLATPTPPLVAEIFSGGDRPLRVETIPTQLPLVVPAGEYTMRVSGDGTLSETFALELDRDKAQSPSLDLRDQNLWAAQQIERSFAVADLGDEHALVLLGKQGIGLSKRSSPVAGWSVEIGPKNSPLLAKSPGFRWSWNSLSEQFSGYGVHDLRPWVAEQAIDLNGDGSRDLICAARHQAWVMAISGKDGGVLWFAGRTADLAVAAAEQPGVQPLVRSAVLGSPIVSQDCDGDGVHDVIATLVDADLSRLATEDSSAAHRWVEAISGKTGQSLWVYELPAKWFDVPTGAAVPYQMRWLCGGATGYTSGGSSLHLGRHRVRTPANMQRTDSHAYRPDVQLVPQAGAARVAVLAGTHLTLLDPHSGQTVEEASELPARCGKPPEWADVDGDGAAELVLMEEIASTAGSQIPTARLVVWSPAAHKQLWSRNLDALWPMQAAWTIEAASWPRVCDLDGDGKTEIVVPDGSCANNRNFGSGGATPWGTLVALKGDTGAQLWTRRLASIDTQVDHFTIGPDLDADGWREVFAVTLALGDPQLFVDALSGKSGQTLWTGRQQLAGGSYSGNEYRLAPPQWWKAGPDGWPQLVTHAIQTSSSGSREVSTAGVFSAATGKLTQLGTNITAMTPVDVDHDGLEDLLVFDSRSPTACDVGGKLHAIRGLAGEAWRMIGNAGRKAGDLDGDAVEDLVSSKSGVIARSGLTGQMLWRGAVQADGDEIKFWPARGRATGAVDSATSHGDLDGDGVDDLLVETFPNHFTQLNTPLSAVSGRTGKPLWTAAEITCKIMRCVLAAEARDLDGDGHLEVVWIAALDHAYPERTAYSTSDFQLWLFVTSGQTGRLLWSHALSPAYGQSPTNLSQFQIDGVTIALGLGDVDKDGTIDLFVPALTSTPRDMETRVLSGKDGKVLWRRPFPIDSNRTLTLDSWTSPVACDLDGDGQTEVVLAELAPHDGQPQGRPAVPQIVAVNGQDGSQKWAWKSQLTAGFWQPARRLTHGEILRPVVLKAGGDRCRIAAIVSGKERQLVVLDADGTPQVRKLGSVAQAGMLWPCPIADTGVDAIAVVDSQEVLALRGDDPAQTLWAKPLGSSGHNQILAVLKASAATPAVLVLATDPTNNAVLGLDVATGRTVWTCPGPIPRDQDGVYLVPEQIELLDTGHNAAPHILYTHGSVSRCRQAAWTPSPTQAAGPLASLASRGVSAATVRLSGETENSRWQRSLPWVEPYFSWRAMLEGIFWGSLLAAALIVIPVAYVANVAISRRFTLTTQLMLPVVAGFALTALLARLPAQSDFGSMAERLATAVAFAPIVVGVSLLVWWIWSGQRRRAAFWLAITVVASAFTAGVTLWHVYATEPLLPEESFDWTLWYLIWFFGACLTSWLLLIALPIKYLGRAVWKRFGGRRRQISSSPLASSPLPEPKLPEPTVATQHTAAR